MFGIVWLTPPAVGLLPEGKAALAVAVFAILVWVTQAVDDALSGLLIVFLLAVMNATKLAGAFSGYSNTALWLIVIGFIMAASMEKSGLSKRIALLLVSAAKGSTVKIYWAIALVMLVMTFLVPSITARTLMMLPIILGIAAAVNAKPGQSNSVKALFLIVAMSGTMMSMGVLTAHVGNPITVALIETATKRSISWSTWFRAGALPAFALAFLSVFIIKAIWPPETKDLGQGQDYVRLELAALGKLSSKEIYTLVVFLVTLTLWATDFYHKINVVVVGLLAVILLLLPRKGILEWHEAQQKVPWNVFMVYGAGLSLGTALVSSGAAKWIAGTLFHPIIGHSQAVQLIILLWGAALIQVFFTGGAPKTTALTPIILAHAVTIGADPLVFALILGITMPNQFLLPMTNMPNAIAVGSGHLSTREVVKTGAILAVFTAGFMSLMVFTYWRWIGLVQ